MALILFDFLVASGAVATNKLVELEEHRSHFVRFCAVYCTNLARSASGRVAPAPGDLPEGAYFVEKPVRPERLLELIRALLLDG
jgi:hypothetical protein